MAFLSRHILFASGAAASVAAISLASYVALRRAAPPGESLAPLATFLPALEPAKVPAPPTAAPKPEFDVVRVEPTGETVVAGRAQPNSTVILLNKGVKIAEGRTDGNGQFVILPPALTPGDHLLTLRATGADGAVDSAQNVVTSVPERAGGQVVAALMTPDQPARLLNDAASPSGVGSKLAIVTAEAGDDGAFLASGMATPGASIRLYLNQSFVAGVEAGADGKWSLRIERGMTPGHYDIRADVVEPGGGKVVARAAAPFDFPDRKPVAAKQEAKSALPSGATVVADIQSVTVERGDSLWRISRKVLGRGVRYTQIYEANAHQIRDPNRIWPGQVFVAPKTNPE